ncbi:MAG: TPM domain-containing protein [Candidatus Omnitrophota bacterium]
MTKRLILAAIAVVTLVAVPLAARAQEDSLPGYSGYVNDFAGIISADNRAAITALAGEVEQKTSAQMAIVTVPTVRPYSIEDYAVRLFEKWGIGQRGKDNGILLLIAVNDRKMRIESGYGLEGAIPDALAKIIITEYITPSFKAGDFNSGIARGAIAIAGLIAKEYNVELSQFGSLPTGAPLPKEPTVLESIFKTVFSILFVLLFLSLRMGFFWMLFLPGSYRRRGGYWHGGGYGGNSGGFSGGFGGFGGGMSGGGGASGGW